MIKINVKNELPLKKDSSIANKILWIFKILAYGSKALYYFLGIIIERMSDILDKISDIDI